MQIAGKMLDRWFTADAHNQTRVADVIPAFVGADSIFGPPGAGSALPQLSTCSRRMVALHRAQEGDERRDDHATPDRPADDRDLAKRIAGRLDASFEPDRRGGFAGPSNASSFEARREHPEAALGKITWSQLRLPIGVRVSCSGRLQ